MQQLSPAYQMRQYLAGLPVGTRIQSPDLNKKFKSGSGSPTCSQLFKKGLMTYHADTCEYEVTAKTHEASAMVGRSSPNFKSKPKSASKTLSQAQAERLVERLLNQNARQREQNRLQCKLLKKLGSGIDAPKMMTPPAVKLSSIPDKEFFAELAKRSAVMAKA